MIVLQKKRMPPSMIVAIAAMAAVVVASNILVQFLYGQWLTWGAFTYPIAFLITDLVNRFHGTEQARRVVFAGFATGIVCSFIGTQIIGDFGPLVTFRIALGSGTAFLVAHLIDINIFDRLRTGTWWQAPLISSLVGSSIDTALFFSIAFSQSLQALDPSGDVAWANEILPLLGLGPMAPLWVSLALADWFVKITLALIALAPFRFAIRSLLPKTI
ncbi:queuosine precursor transporter [Thioalkalivibrio sp. HK1]|uniref:queuosine precursor transporter n=1 Tax=Thioalkalivibrio sp. HK1 TaxID=1469245 RepID=UPI0004B59824|nr:queuosine precursor transporter [Thioalkalivibrio sp. HK1]